MKNKALVLTQIGVFVALASIIGYLESLIPPIIPFLPFLKIGLSNIIIIIVLVKLGPIPGLAISFLKSLIVPLILGNPMLIMYSLPASLIATLFMIIFLYNNTISLITISILSAIIHNVVQICFAYLYMQSSLVFYYLPYLSLIGMLTGSITGIISLWLLNHRALNNL